MMMLKMRGVLYVAPYAAVLIAVLGLTQPDLLPPTTPWWGVILSRGVTTISRGLALAIVLRSIKA